MATADEPSSRRSFHPSPPHTQDLMYPPDAVGREMIVQSLMMGRRRGGRRRSRAGEGVVEAC